MPLSGNTYVAPTWVDNAPPALDAAELQAICDAIVQNQGDAAALQTALQQAVQSLTTMVNGRAQVVTGSYVGTGTYSSGNPTTINFSILPKIIVVVGNYSRGQTLCASIPPDGVTVYSNVFDNDSVELTSSGNSVSFVSYESPDSQLNYLGSTYYYAGII